MRFDHIILEVYWESRSPSRASLPTKRGSHLISEAQLRSPKGLGACLLDDDLVDAVDDRTLLRHVLFQRVEVDPASLEHHFEALCLCVHLN